MKVPTTYEVPIDSLLINVIIYRWDKNDFVIVDLNSSCEKSEQVSKSDVIGKCLCDIFPSVKEFGLFDVLRRVNETGISEQLESHFYEDARIKGWRKNEIIKLKNGDVMAIYKDLTKEKELEILLSRINNYIDNSQTIVFFWKAYDGWPVEYVSKNVSDFGYKIDDFILGRITYKDIIYKDDYARVLKEVEEHTNNKNDKFIQTYRIVTADGSVRWVDDRTIIERDDNGVVKNYLGTITDITQAVEIQKKLKDSEEQFHAIAENSLMGIFIYQDTFKYINPAITRMIGYSAEELYKMSPVDLVEDGMKPEFIKNIKKRLAGIKFPKTYNDVKFTTKSGQVKITRLMVETIEHKGGFAGLGTIIDITDMKKTVQKLKMLAQAIEQTDDMVLITDKDGIITYVNDAYVINSGYRHNELIGRTPSILKSDIHDHEFYQNLWDTISNGQIFSGIIVNSKKNKELYHIEITISPIFNESNEIISYVATSKDITSRIEMEEELNKRANLDSLTGIYNRYRGNEIIDAELDKVIRYSSGFAILMLDIDYFKNINDTHGHDIGDKVLIKLTRLISMHMRKSDHFIRWGGEEFIIISEYLDKNRAIKFAQKIRKIIASYEFEQELHLTVSFGVSIAKENDTKQSILKRVDNALYKAKDSGRNCVEYL